jgi:hypothetical protein
MQYLNIFQLFILLEKIKCAFNLITKIPYKTLKAENNAIGSNVYQ